MQKDGFLALLNGCIPYISEEWKNVYGELLQEEHWSVLGNRIYAFFFENELNHNILPVFSEEIKVDYGKHYQYFKRLRTILDIDESERPQLLAMAIEETPIESLLIILGQRKTSATITDEAGIPPLKEYLLESCFAAYNSQLCKAARAREKHIMRNEDDPFWGKMEGSPAEKEQVAKSVVTKIIEEKTWWNVFTHYKHEVVYEIRIASGQGIRWKKKDLELIGFLEPFLNDKENSNE